MELLSRLFLNARAIEPPGRDWTPLQAEIAGLVEDWDGDTPQVAVIGAFSSGKTTLINGLFGLRLPVRRTATTAVITQVVYGPARQAEVAYKRSVRLTLVASDARSLDRAAAVALRAWTARPPEFGVEETRSVDDHGVGTTADLGALRRQLDLILAEPEGPGPASTLRRAVGRLSGNPRPSLAGTWEVLFKARGNTVFALDNQAELHLFSNSITEPEHALLVRRATVYIPDERLRTANLLDTAGLCSPINFHKDVTSELLKRRPEKIVVLLDARRLESPTNGQALASLTRFVAAPDDFRKITFGFTHWDTALRTEMEEDSEAELDFNSSEERARVSRDLEARMRRRLGELLEAVTGVRCVKPNAFTLALGEDSPRDLRGGAGRLWDDIAADCSGWVGIDMWAERWRDAVGLGTRLRDAHASAVKDLREGEEAKSTDLDGEARRLDATREAIETATKRLLTSATEAVEAQKDRMLTDIRSLDSKSAILDYLSDGFWKSANESLNAVQAASSAARQQLAELSGRFLALSIISIDRKTLGLDASAKAAATGHVSGVAYGLKSVWDFFLSGVVELTAEHRRLAREVLREQANGVIDLLNHEVSRWSALVGRHRVAVVTGLDEQRAGVESRRSNLDRYRAKLAKKRAFLERTRPATDRACDDVEQFAGALARAAKRLSWSRADDFRAVLVTDRGQVRLVPGQENDALLAFNAPPRARWFYVDLRAHGEEMRFWPRGDRAGIEFLAGAHPPLEAPPFPHRVVLRLSTMEATIHASPQGAGR